MKKIGVFGSAFGPPTLGHLSLMEQFSLDFDEIWLVPSYSHGFGKKMYPYHLRLSLTEKFASDIMDLKRGFSIFAADIESKIEKKDSSPIFTYDLLDYLQKEYGSECEFSFIAGPDNKDNWDKFYKSEEVMSRWEVVFGQEHSTIRSTEVRKLLKDGCDFSSMVTDGVRRLLVEMKERLTPESNWVLSPEAEQK